MAVSLWVPVGRPQTYFEHRHYTDIETLCWFHVEACADTWKKDMCTSDIQGIKYFTQICLKSSRQVCALNNYIKLDETHRKHTRKHNVKKQIQIKHKYKTGKQPHWNNKHKL